VDGRARERNHFDAERKGSGKWHEKRRNSLEEPSSDKGVARRGKKAHPVK